ncbi:sodium/bile acid cotransporter [Platysternon megacephalum]|uniref:Arrestin-C n=1 Tax=Platysternon megacephalum TaxID=55544 RepID=A0A4D9F1E2_9SAUR|nr:sodium/bile acid cotransporter [Platysternon megacephalum]
MGLKFAEEGWSSRTLVHSSSQIIPMGLPDRRGNELGKGNGEEEMLKSDTNSSGDIITPAVQRLIENVRQLQLSIYLGKRDFVDHVDSVEPVDGVVLIDPEYLKDRKVYVTLTCAFRYGRDDLDVIGLTFRKDLYVLSTQIYPPVPEQTPTSLTPLQEKLLKKLGEHAYPFTFEVGTSQHTWLFPFTHSSIFCCAQSLWSCGAVATSHAPQQMIQDQWQLSQGVNSCHLCFPQACGVDFEVKGFCAENLEEKIHKRNSVRLVIRKVQFAPVNTGPAPKSETTRQFMMSDKPLHLEASLDKEIYYHGDPIAVNININNTTNKIVKKIKISVEQITDVVLYSLDKYMKNVCTEEIIETVAATSTLSKSYTVTPSLSSNREKRGLALDGKLKHEDTNLASTTVLRAGMDKEVLGILVSYKVKVNLVVSRGGDVGVELPLILMHPKPTDVMESPVSVLDQKIHHRAQTQAPQTCALYITTDTMTLQCDVTTKMSIVIAEEDIVIEEFARQKLKGEKDDEDEKEEADKDES